MTRPQVIRADTIDLQDQNAPSAKDHTRQPVRPGALGEGPPAPHQADALKHVELEISEQHGRSPRASQDLSGKELGLLHHEDGEHGGGDDGNNLLRNSGVGAAAEEEAGDAEGDESLDDDMMDKISSSPSIGDDGALPWPSRGSSFHSNSSPTGPPGHRTQVPETPSDAFSSSPFSETPKHYPLAFYRKSEERTPSKVHHQQGEYPMALEKSITAEEESKSESRQDFHSMIEERNLSDFDNDSFEKMDESYEEDLDDLQNLLLPGDDPLLDKNLDDTVGSPTVSISSSPGSKDSWDTQDFTAADDDTKDVSFSDDERFVDSGWGGECLQDAEDIDFEFVYALHTFVATVEGQANATKGDTMVLLDDSNSYWWLVRVVKDSSIGYLPAEHIETPLERLARLNKHRNLDLSQTMLGDEEDKKAGNPLNPLIVAMRRRKTKTVQFSAPSYVEPSDNDYSSEEEEDGHDEFLGHQQDSNTTQINDQRQQIDDTAVVEPLKTRGQVQNGTNIGEVQPDHGRQIDGPDLETTADNSRMSDDTYERSDDGTSNKSRKGTVRNTDSFFKDDGVETRKINLTPSLLRDDSSGSTIRSTDTRELNKRPSFDDIDKDDPPSKGKDDKKKKEKRGMLGGMFKRKDKKSKGQDKETDEIEKTSNEISRQSPQPKESMESLSQEAKAAQVTPQPHRQTSKLQKSPPAKLSPKSSYAQREASVPRPSTVEQQQHQQSAITLGPHRTLPPAADHNGSIRAIQPDPSIIREDTAPALNFNPAATAFEVPTPSESPKDTRRGMFSPIKDALNRSPSESKPEKARKAKQRMPMDEFESSSSEDESMETPAEPSEESNLREDPETRHLAIAQDTQHDVDEPEPLRKQHQRELPPDQERLSDSPIEVVPPEDHPQRPLCSEHQTRAPHQPPALMVDTSSTEAPNRTSPVSPIEDSSPELVEAPTTADPTPTRDEEAITPASSARPSTPPWSDANLRAYLEDDSEIRDLLLVVHDKSNVKPARRDHPIVKNMYREENRKLGEMSSKLDSLLGDYLARKGRTAAVR